MCGIVGYLGNGVAQDALIDGLRRLEYRGYDSAGAADDVFRVPAVHEVVRPLVATIPLQLFAYHFARIRGLDVDKPCNLAKSVTVE